MAPDQNSSNGFGLSGSGISRFVRSCGDNPSLPSWRSSRAMRGVAIATGSATNSASRQDANSSMISSAFISMPGGAIRTILRHACFSPSFRCAGGFFRSALVGSGSGGLRRCGFFAKAPRAPRISVAVRGLLISKLRKIHFVEKRKLLGTRIRNWPCFAIFTAPTHSPATRSHHLHNHRWKISDQRI
jgi:hypothetical protein